LEEPRSAGAAAPVRRRDRPLRGCLTSSRSTHQGDRVVWTIPKRLERPRLKPGTGGSLPHGVTRSDRPAAPLAGRYLHWIPVFSTNAIPVRQARSGTRARLGFRASFGRCGGTSGAHHRPHRVAHQALGHAWALMVATQVRSGGVTGRFLGNPVK
jgi:hypothetical protein